MNATDNNSQRYVPYRAVIPFYILYDLDLKANHLRLYGQIEQMESNPNPNVQASFSYQWFADQLGINKRNTMQIAKLLVQKGYIEHREVAPGKYIWNTKKASVSVENEGGECRTATSPSVAQRHPPSVAARHPKIPEFKNPKDNTKPPISPKGESSRFEEFWNLYPTKTAKKACLEKWKRKKLDALADDILEKLQTQIDEDDQWKSGFIPNPLTYLNQERWEDEIKKQTKKTSKSNSFSQYLENSRKNGETYDQHGSVYDPFR